MSLYQGMGEPEVVNGKALKEVLQRWRESWVADRPLSVGNAQTVFGERVDKMPAFMGPTQWLAQESGINIRQVQRMINGQQEWVGLGKADALLQAIGVGVTVDDIGVVPNPRWNQERWNAYMAERGCA